MKPEYILLIVAGGVFLVLVFFYLLTAYETRKNKNRITDKILKSYTEENLRQMEYDVVFYDEKIHGHREGDEEKQVTIEDLLSQSVEVNSPNASPVYIQLEDKGVEEIVGTYNREKTE